MRPGAQRQFTAALRSFFYGSSWWWWWWWCGGGIGRMITAAIVALDIIVHHGTSGDDWSDSSGNNKGRRREWRWSYVPRWSPRIASNRINRPPQRSEHAGMNPMSLIVVLCSKLRRPAPIRRRTRAAPSSVATANGGEMIRLDQLRSCKWGLDWKPASNEWPAAPPLLRRALHAFYARVRIRRLGG